jgi:hypothetical protein
VYPYREVHERITRDLYEELLASGDILFPGHDPPCWSWAAGSPRM